MELVRVKNCKDNNYLEAITLYKKSFPFHEQRIEKSQLEILNNEDYRFSLIYVENSFVGLVLYWETNDFIYIEHLAILEEKRNLGYGRKCLNLLKEKGKTIILEIDPLKNPIDYKRKLFYESVGFIENKYIHYHPSYHKNIDDHLLLIMTYPNLLEETKYNMFFEYLKNVVMLNAQI